MLVAILTLSILCNYLTSEENHITDEQWFALCEVESGNNANRIGKDGSSGPAQIRKICVTDVNRIIGKDLFNNSDRFDSDKSRAIFKIYTDHYAGKDASFEKRLRIWNGGPRGHKKSSTLKYVKRVTDILE